MGKPNLFFPLAMTVIALLFWLNTYLNPFGGVIAIGISLAVAHCVMEWHTRRHYHRWDNVVALYNDDVSR